jgi:ubiquitin C-terminal hydrolase
VLIIHVTRFKWSGRTCIKDKTHLQVTSNLQVYGKQYSLYSIITHIEDTCKQGHYISFVKSSNNEWYRCNDEMVSKVNAEDAYSTEAYLIVYYQRSDSKGWDTGIKSNEMK